MDWAFVNLFGADLVDGFWAISLHISGSFLCGRLEWGVNGLGFC
jgi:hypothetical protein